MQKKRVQVDTICRFYISFGSQPKQLLLRHTTWLLNDHPPSVPFHSIAMRSTPRADFISFPCRNQAAKFSNMHLWSLIFILLFLRSVIALFYCSTSSLLYCSTSSLFLLWCRIFSFLWNSVCRMQQYTACRNRNGYFWVKKLLKRGPGKPGEGGDGLSRDLFVAS